MATARSVMDCPTNALIRQAKLVPAILAAPPQPFIPHASAIQLNAIQITIVRIAVPAATVSANQKVTIVILY